MLYYNVYDINSPVSASYMQQSKVELTGVSPVLTVCHKIISL